MVLPTTQTQNKQYSNQSLTRGGCCGVLRCVQDSFYWRHETRKGGASWLCLFGISLQIPTEVTSPNIADATFKPDNKCWTFFRKVCLDSSRTVGNQLPLPVFWGGPRGPRVGCVVWCLCSCACPARPAAGAGVCPPIGCSTRWSRTSAGCTSALSPSTWSGS